MRRVERERERQVEGPLCPCAASKFNSIMDDTAAADAFVFTHNIPSVVISLLHAQAWCEGPRTISPAPMKQQVAGSRLRAYSSSVDHDDDDDRASSG